MIATLTSHRLSAFTALLIVTLGWSVPSASAQGADQNLGQASLEELMAVRVTSVSRKAQRVEDVAAAVFVITREDIRRSGLTTLPEILRLAPGVQVAHGNANRWAVSIRGFNDVFANKLLVLIDGRSVYTRTFGGVLWESQDLMVSDIERIEVIRGPGGAMWGANAVNGVINVITRSASDTQGLSVELSAGTFEQQRVGIRYGGTVWGADYRVFTQWSGYGDAQTDAGLSAEDRWRSLLTGARAEWSRGSDTFLAEGRFTDGSLRPRWLDYSAPGGPSVDAVSHRHDASALARWTRTKATGSVLQLQASHMSNNHHESILMWSERATDVDLQYEAPERARQSIVFGGGFRAVDIRTKNTPTLSLFPKDTSILNAFVQDEIAVAREVSVILGSKVEHDQAAGWGVLPSARLMWRPTTGQRAWAAVSKARRTPTVIDRGLRYLIPIDMGGVTVLAGFLGNPDYGSESLVEAEAGYRLRIGQSAGVEAAVFQGTYDDLPGGQSLGMVVEPSGLVFFAETSANLMGARTRGSEFNAHWSPATGWRLSGSYTFTELTPRSDSASLDEMDIYGDDPTHQWQLHSTSSVGRRAFFDLGLYHTGRLQSLEVPAHTRLDARLEFKLTDKLSAVATGRNLLHSRHREFSGLTETYVSSSIPRSAHVMLRWKL
jgi:iron complex outermembrane receptor protein